jgi:iron complex transport system ATP-binding protein
MFVFSQRASATHTKQPLLQLQNAQLHLAGRVFGAFDLPIHAGEHIAILGPSGAGKSTLLKLCAGDLRPSAGQVQLQGKALAHWSLPELSRLRAVLPQSSEVAFALPVELVIALGRCARRYDPQQTQIVQDAAQLACAQHLLGRRFDTLSGGEKARVQLARVFAQFWDAEPGLLLVDEPLAALDPGLQFDLADAMHGFAQRGGHALVAVLHDVNHALQHFQRLLLIKDGRMLADVAAHADAHPLLEELYGIGFACAHSANGQTVLIAQGRPAPSDAAPLDAALCA